MTFTYETEGKDEFEIEFDGDIDGHPESVRVFLKGSDVDIYDYLNTNLQKDIDEKAREYAYNNPREPEFEPDWYEEDKKNDDPR